jgi:hypothetical protein
MFVNVSFGRVKANLESRRQSSVVRLQQILTNISNFSPYAEEDIQTREGPLFLHAEQQHRFHHEIKAVDSVDGSSDHWL